MVNKVYVNEETGITWQPSGGTETLTLTSLGTNSGRVGDEHDFGAAPQARRYRFQLRTEFVSNPVVGEPVMLYVARGDGTYRDSNLGASDAALTSDNELRNLLHIGTLVVHVSDATKDFILHGDFECGARYLSPVVWNETTIGLSATAADHVLTIWPMPWEIQ